MIIVQTSMGANFELGGLMERARRPRAILREATGGGLKVLRAHFREKQKKPNRLGGKRTNFWLDVYKSTQVTEVTDTRGTITIGDRRFALQVYGGVVRPKEKKALTIPLSAEAHGRRAETLEREKGVKLFRVKSKRGKDLLAEAAADGKLTIHYVLRASARVPADPEAMPRMADLERGVLDAARGQLEAEIREAGLA